MKLAVFTDTQISEYKIELLSRATSWYCFRLQLAGRNWDIRRRQPVVSINRVHSLFSMFPIVYIESAHIYCGFSFKTDAISCFQNIHQNESNFWWKWIGIFLYLIYSNFENVRGFFYVVWASLKCDDLENLKYFDYSWY